MEGKRLVVSVAMLLVFIGLIHANTSDASDDDNSTVREAAEQFYFALNAMFKGNLASMQKVGSHADDVTYMGPGGGFRVGWDQVLADWEAQAAMRLGGVVKPNDMRFTVGRDLAVVSNYEIGKMRL